MLIALRIKNITIDGGSLKWMQKENELSTKDKVETICSAEKQRTINAPMQPRRKYVSPLLNSYPSADCHNPLPPPGVEVPDVFCAFLVDDVET